MPEPLGIGVVGVGALALRGILPHLSLDDVASRARVVALCDPVLPRAQAAADELGVPAAYGSLDELLDDPAVDAVTIASPISLHYEHCLRSLAAGKHVHVNKTMATSVEESDELIAAAEQKGLTLVASPGECLRPQIARTRELIGEGAIGTLAWAICGGSFNEYHEQEGERADAPGATVINPSWYFKKPGGGPMYDMTVYALHQLTSVLGPAKRVTALSGLRIHERQFQGMPIDVEADDNTILTLDFGGGLYAVAFGAAAGELTQQFAAGIYFGTRGTIEGVLLNGEPFDFPGRELTAHAPPTDWDAQMAVLPDVAGEHLGLPESHVFQDIMELVDSVQEGRKPRVTAEQARHVIDIIESGFRANDSGRTQDLSTSFEPVG